MREINQYRRASVGVHVTKNRAFGLKAEGTVHKIYDSFHHQLSATKGPTLRPLHTWGGECGQRRVLLL